MKHKNYSNLKNVLCLALPFMALGLITACSNNDSTILPNDTTVSGLTFTATSEAALTRIGLDEGSITNIGSDSEPVIWVNGDKFSFNFVEYGKSSGQVFEFVASNVGNNGMSCAMNPAPGFNIPNGLYQVYVLNPGRVGNFVGGSLSGTTIDLSGQSQPKKEDLNNYSNLSDYYYQHAYTIVEMRNNAIVNGNTSLSFTTITSMLRFIIRNQLGEEIKVKDIALNYSTSGNKQFYDKGIFDMSTETPTLNPAANATFNKAYLATDQLLGATLGSSFNAYMSVFPTAGYPSGSSEQINIVIKLDINGQAKKAVFGNISVNTFDTENGAYCKFDAGVRTLFTLNITSARIEDDNDGGNPPTPSKATVSIGTNAGTFTGGSKQTATRRN